MAQQAQAIQPVTQPNTPAIRQGSLDREIEQRFDSIAQRAFEIFENNGRLLGQDLANWFQAERELFHLAHIDVSESDQAYTVRAEVPGFDAKDLDINLEGRRLTISGTREKKQERKEQKTVYSESCSDRILRVVDLPGDIEAANAKANLKDGILELAIPKAAPAKRIPIAPKAT